MGSSSSTLYIAVFVISVCVFARHIWSQRKVNPHQLPYPPGPSPLPIVGNIRDVTAVRPWLNYDALSKKYGDIVYLSVFGQPIVILSSMRAISDLLEKRSNTYSDRPHLTMISDLMGLEWFFVMMGYGEEWRKRRRCFHQYFNSNAVEQYHDVHIHQAHLFLRRLLETPDNFYHHIRQTFSSTIMKITYGIDVKEKNDEYVSIAEVAMLGFSAGVQFGRYWVEFIPFLRYIPAWFPGASFKREAEYRRPFVRQMLEKPFNAVKLSMNTGSSTPCIAASMLENLTDGPSRDDEEEVARDSAGIAFGGGADTTTSAVQSFFLAMVLYPEVQRKAQAELDIVIGPNRLPDFTDRQSLPYIEAVVKETLRWQPVGPLAVPHMTSETDEYRGYHIPKGAVVLGNSWSILHDPEQYPDPHVFKPERFLKNGRLDTNVQDPTVACFGFGRRICAGRHLSTNSIYSTVASVLHVFNISHALDEDGQPISVSPDMSSGSISSPIPFRCSIIPCSSSAEALIYDSIQP